MTLIIDIADAVKAELNAHAFGMEFEAVRKYRPLFELPDMKTLHVTVVPKGETQKTADRRSVQYDLQVDVAVQKRLAPPDEDEEAPVDDEAQIDALMALGEAIKDFFRLRRLTAFKSAAWVGAENAPVYDPEHLDRMRQFTSVVTLTYRVVR